MTMKSANNTFYIEKMYTPHAGENQQWLIYAWNGHKLWGQIQGSEQRFKTEKEANQYVKILKGIKSNPDSDEIFIRLETKAERNKSHSYPLAHIPDKSGYRKVYKPYGKDGAGYYYIKNEEKNPMKKVKTYVHPEALVALNRMKSDSAAGHDAEDYWRGAAAAYFTANPSRVSQYQISYKLKKGRKIYKIRSSGTTGEEAWENLEKTFPDITDNKIYISAMKEEYLYPGKNPLLPTLLTGAELGAGATAGYYGVKKILSKSNPFPVKTKSTRTIKGNQYWYAGRTQFFSKAKVELRQLVERGIGGAVTQREGWYLLWTRQPVYLDLSEPLN